ncbi:MAG: DUF3071 domain-containing protein [Burkholderiaceae bacterium]|nr:DUF3071 domain-containing protein [Microbacteriaceae bacterium]
MQDLTVIGVENGALLVASRDGTRYRIAIDDVLQSKLRQSLPAPGSGRKLAPRDIQAHIRSGMSAEEVAATTGVAVEYIRKFEGPVLAEREFVIESALGVAVHTAIDSDPLATGSTFGSVIRDRLRDLGATGERWASWKEADGAWVVKLAFTADQIDHDARWHYEPKKAALAPINNEANTLSQQGEMPGGLIPRLRAVGEDERPLDSSRFDSGAFDVRGTDARDDTAFQVDAIAFGRHPGSSPEAASAAINRAPAESVGSSQTSDLLDALRRRRGERESAAAWDGDEAKAAHPSTGGIRLIDIPLDVFDEGPAVTAPLPLPPFAPAAIGQQTTGQQAGQTSGQSGTQSSSSRSTARKGRASMPSWDEIVFGARSDDDPA